MKIYKLNVCQVPGNMLSAPQTQNSVSSENLYVTGGIVVRYGTILQSHSSSHFNSLHFFFLFTTIICSASVLSFISCHFFYFLTGIFINGAFYKDSHWNALVSVLTSFFQLVIDVSGKLFGQDILSYVVLFPFSFL